jgi:hypothetical protein
MRINFGRFAAHMGWDAEYLDRSETEVTHDYYEDDYWTLFYSCAIDLARNGGLKDEIRDFFIPESRFPINFRIDDIRPTYSFNETCQETVPQAIECFLESTSFEDAIRIAISLGGDSATIGSITGAIAEAYYGVPEDIKEKALTYLDKELRTIYDEWIASNPLNDEIFKTLTKYIGKIATMKYFKKFIIDYERSEFFEYKINIFIADYNKLDILFEEEFYQFLKLHPEYQLVDCNDILEQPNIPLYSKNVCPADMSKFEAHSILSLIMKAIHDETLLTSIKNDIMTRWLKRLKDIDWQKKPHQLLEVDFSMGTLSTRLTFKKDGTVLSKIDYRHNNKPSNMRSYDSVEAAQLAEIIRVIHIEYWNESNYAPCFTENDTTPWRLTVRYSDSPPLMCRGRETYADNFDKLIKFLEIDNYY